ncbi:DNA-binding response regulator [Patiriisocius marinistellae]|uniref:DNA-binding response regulator n=1 Tax=Patiriisocius marinistellae TaxID=2494560 RepID=A0A5J4G008_9FLAO|nr:LytTR family DNA-binding domain-containing protein [Patiriisocius marinistellae]GEQ87028.1 DNA-binding response regulator [Patiriisocius marinistellae]
MNCIIIDDEETARSIIAHLCSSYDELNVICDFSNALDAIKFLNKNEIDLIFLDIHMPDFTGFDLIETLKNPPKIVLTTSDKNFAIDAYEYDCIKDYLVKPITKERFAKTLEKVNKTTFSKKNRATHSSSDNNQKDNELFINIDRRLIKIDISSIILVEAKGDYILLKTEGKNYTVHSSLKKIHEKLPVNLFLKVHRSYLINTSKIVDIEDNSVLIDGNVIPVSRSNRPELMRRLNLL